MKPNDRRDIRTHALILTFDGVGLADIPLVGGKNAYSSLSYPSITGALYAESVKTMQRYLEQWTALEQESLEWLRSQRTKAIEAGVETEFTHSVGDAGRVFAHSLKRGRQI